MKDKRLAMCVVMSVALLAAPGCAIYADDGAWAHSNVWYEEVGEFFVVASAFTIGVLLGSELGEGHGYYAGGGYHHGYGGGHGHHH